MKRKMTGTAIVLTGILMLGGCGANKEASVPEIAFPANSAEETVETAPESAPAEQESEETSEMETEEQAVEEIVGSAPTISITKTEKEWYTEDQETLLLTVEESLVTLESGGCDALAAALSEHWALAQVDCEEIIGYAREHYDRQEDKSYFYGYSIYSDVELVRSDSTVISFVESYSEYTGGAHGNYGYYGATFDVESGRELALADILSDAEGFYAKAVEYIVEDLEKNFGDGLFPEYREYVAGSFDADRSPCWYLNAGGIVVTYNPYEVGPYAMGPAEVLLPYDVFDAYIDGRYTAPHSELVAQVPANVDVSLLLGEENVMLDVSSNEYSLYEVTVLSGMSSDEIDTFAYHRGAYVIKRDGRSFLITVEDYASDDNVIWVYEVTGGSVKRCDELVGGEVSSLMGTEQLGIRMLLYVLGTYGSDMVYTLDGEGKLVQTSDIFEINPRYEMTVIRELPVTMDGAERTLAVGEKILITGVSNMDVVYFKLADSGETGEIHYTREAGGWELLIDGVSEFEYFEVLPYAG